MRLGGADRPFITVALIFAAAAPLAGQSSFAEIRGKVYAHPRRPDDLPEYGGAGAWETFEATALRIISDRISGSMRRTLSSQSDYKDAAVKMFHPKGVCAEGVWEINVQNRYTGLFTAGTRVLAMVRMSAGGNNTVHYAKFPTSAILGHHRNLAVAVKLFPTQDPDGRVLTRNLLTFDQTGLDGNPSPWFMRGPRTGPDRYGEQFFTNWMAGSGPVTAGFARLFSAFARDVRYRRIDPLANTDAHTRNMTEARAPRFIRLVPRAQFPADERQTRWKDFRRELLDLGKSAPLAFDIEASESNFTERTHGKGMLLGRLTLGLPVVSEFCDQQLHFAHYPNP